METRILVGGMWVVVLGWALLGCGGSGNANKADEASGTATVAGSNGTGGCPAGTVAAPSTSTSETDDTQALPSVHCVPATGNSAGSGNGSDDTIGQGGSSAGDSGTGGTSGQGTDDTGAQSGGGDSGSGGNGGGSSSNPGGSTLAPTCNLGYPFNSTNPRTSVTFNESTILTGYMPAIAGPTDIIKAYYVDEHALTLGKNANGKTISPCNCNTNPDNVQSPSIGDPTAVDSSGRPIYPALFITDITNDPNSTAGDWQNGGTPIPPSGVLGTWKTLGGGNPATYNNYNVGNGDVVPQTTDARDLTRPVFSAEVQWDVKKLNLPAGHVFRMEFMFHDGDRESDVGVGCATVHTY
jgi:hypothetical protein